MNQGFFLVLLLLLQANFSQAMDDSAAELLEKLSGLNSFSAQFQQQLFDANGSEIQVTTGTLQASKPGKLFWETNSPFEQQIVADGQLIWLYDPDLLQVTSQPYPEELAKTPAMLLIGETAGLKEQYDIEQRQLSKSNSEFILIPKAEDNLYTKVVLQFEGDTPVVMQLFDTLQQQTHIQFSQVQLNATIDDTVFSFTVPEGADLIRHE